ncbi:MAG: MBL fold metallo-hydrolase [Lentisphaerae bacterium]|jgi:glyoxylase-like metal-dependent hydrolase (beta-lactamase superfamily II)|nr:MBL fold metallo-hydrolase [Lentisphaerota bacterium]
MNSEIIVVGSFEVNCVVIWDDPKLAWVIDPGADPDAIMGFLKRHDLEVGLYFLTHGHIDHISALDGVLAKHPAPVHLHSGDVAWAFSNLNRFPPYNRVPQRPATLQPTSTPAERLAVGGVTAEIIETPGHSPGGQCLWFKDGDLLISGDTLFASSVGRTDLPGGSGRVLQESLRRLTKLPEQTLVIPGHGPTTTIGDEKRHNPYIS